MIATVELLSNDITKHVEIIRSSNDFGNLYDNGPPISPRNLLFDTSRRPSLQVTAAPPTSNNYRSNLNQSNLDSPKRQPSLSVPDNTGHSPSSTKANHATMNFNAHSLQNIPHLSQNLTSSSTPPPVNTIRRHTFADIRQHYAHHNNDGIDINNNNNNNTNESSPHRSGQWPSSPFRQTHTLNNNGDHQQIRDVLAQYDLPKSNSISGMFQYSQQQSRHYTPPDNVQHHYSQQHQIHAPLNMNDNIGSSQWQGPKFSFRNVDFQSAPPTRRSSLASNVHSLLNPAETVEREDEDVDIGDGSNGEERKRRRVN